MTELPPAPLEADVEVTHDGLVWRTRRHGRGEVWLLGAALAAAGVGLSFLLDPRLAFGGVGALWLGAAALFAVQNQRWTEVRLDDRSLVVERHGLFGTEVERIAMADLREVVVGENDFGAPRHVVVKTRDDRVVLGEGASSAIVGWLHLAVLAAAEGQARRARAEGREYPFLRTAPEALRDLTRDREGPT